MKNKTIVILQQRMAGWLMFNGLKMLGVKKDLKNPNRNIYIFENTHTLKDAMAKYNNAKTNFRY